MARCPTCGHVSDEDRADEVREVVAAWVRYHPRYRGGKPGSREWVKIRLRLMEGYSVKDLCDAIDGIHRSPHHCGLNETGTRYLTLELCMRHADHVQRFIETADAPPVAPLTQKSSTTAMALAARKAARQRELPQPRQPRLITDGGGDDGLEQ